MIDKLEFVIYWVGAGTFLFLYVPLRLVVRGGSRIVTFVIAGIISAILALAFFLGLAQGELSTMTMVIVTVTLFYVVCVRPDVNAFVTETQRQKV